MVKRDVQNSVQERPPVVAVLGHVDHGKTSLLDKIRKTHIAERETGGITQSIGAYQIDFNGKKITFIDTPGHAAFEKMRARGGQIADLVVLVVAVDDGVMPQTIESIRHIKEAQVPFLVALNKIDAPGADIERVKNQLAQNGVPLEGLGGDVVALPVSAKTGEGLEDLLEMITLLTQMHEIRGDPQAPLRGVLIESNKTKAGSAGTVIVKNGTLKIGDQILIGGVVAKVRGLMDASGQRLTEAGPGEPVEVLGFSSPPPVGAEVVRVETSTRQVETLPIPKPPHFTREEEQKLKIILKADSTGSLEALSAGLSPEVLVVLAGVGEMIDSDVLLAQITKAQIWGFRVKISSQIAKLAENEKVKIKTYDIIYKFFEDLEKEVLGHQAPKEEKILGRAEIIAEFVVEGKRIAGSRVLEGRVGQSDRLLLKRGDRVIGETKAISMQKRSKAINEARGKEEFGAVLSPELDFKVGDMLISVPS